MKLLLALLLLSFTASAQKAVLSGLVEDENGKPLPFATVYIQNTTRGTSANERGLYRIVLDDRATELVFRYIGYEPYHTTVTLSRDSVLHIRLKQELFTLPPIELTSGEDPANRIMRAAIANRKRHLHEVNTFTASVYIKGVQKLVNAPKKFLGEDVAAVLQLDSARKGILYLSESQSTLFFKSPDHYREIMLASKVSGKNQSLSFNKATDLNVNFYENILQFDELSIRGFISPLADYAFSYYNYQLLGSFVREGQTIHKIKVVPRRQRDPAFSGNMYIMDGSWRLYGTDLLLSRSANINFVDTLTLSQQFIPVNDSLWMPSSVQLNFKGKVLGFSFNGYFLSVYSNYTVNAPLSKRIFNGEILKILPDARKNDESYWSVTRPIPLTNEEKLDYQVKDSIERIQNTRQFKDSVDAENNRVTPLKIAAFGYTKTNSTRNTTFRVNPVVPGIFYNTVEGFGYQHELTFKKEYNLKNFIELNSRLRYGFANHHFNPLLEGRYFYDPVNMGFISVKVGSEVLDISNLRSSMSLSNSFNTLLYETNYRKFYEKRMLSFNGSYEAATGLFGTSSLEWSRRTPLRNTSSYSFIDRKNKQFSSNNPFTPEEDIPLFPEHRAVTFTAELDYAPAARYTTRPEGKVYEPFKFPRFVVTYRKGFPSVLGSDVDFDFASFEIYQNELKLGLLGKSSFTLKTGKFLNRNQVYYPDFHHYLGNNSLIFESSLRNFHFLDLYQYSIDKQFFEAHYEHNLGGFIVNKLPLIRKLRLDEVMGGAYLDQPGSKNYYEVFFGLQRLIFRVDYSIAFSYNVKVFNGIKISYGLKGR